MRPLTLVLSYCSQPLMLARQYQEFLTYPPGISVIIVDDASRETAAIDVPRPEGLPPLRIYRIGVWRDWGWPMARNLGMSEAGEGWVLLTDMDHVLTAENAVKLLEMDADPGAAYRPCRVKPSGEPYKPHNDSFALTRETFWKTGGYSLKYLGWYGTSSIFSRRLHMLANVHTTDAFKLTVFNLGGEDIGGIAGAGTTGMGRKGSDHHVSRSPFAHETKTAHLTAPTGVLDFPWQRQL